MKSLEDFKAEAKKLPKPQRLALDAMAHAFRFAVDLKQDFGMIIFVVGHKDLASERPVHWISNYSGPNTDKMLLDILEYGVKRINKKLKNKSEAAL